MSYQLKSVTLRTNNSKEGTEKINEIWTDIISGKLPLLFDNNHIFKEGLSPISKYSNYESDENGNYDLTIMTVTSDFFSKMESLVSKGLYKKYDLSGEIEDCTKEAWKKVWSDHKTGKINRAFTEDFESTVPSQYTKDGQAHCYLYIAIK